MTNRTTRFTALAMLVAGLAAPAGAQGLSPDELAKVKAAEAARVAAIAKVYGAVVAIYGMNRQGGGSGVIIHPDGYALTNNHVVAGAGRQGFGGLADGRLYKWHMVGTDPGGDIAIIKLHPPTEAESGVKSEDFTFPFAELGNSDTVRVGDFCMAMGNPFILAEDQTPTVTMGIVSGVKRYQGGSGGVLGVYGNCIQIDSSINPGNSGGPLFNMAARVVGINGRGSFEERGRVNVGLGYAISSEQIKNFIPDLLATKIAQHGTLDATFSDRGPLDDRHVVCSAINLDAVMAQLGMQLGDRLVRFDGIDIVTANQYTNLISTLPANWPVEVLWDHDGAMRSAWVRLIPLPYPKQPRRPARPVPAPKPDQKDKNNKEPRKAGEDGGAAKQDGDEQKKDGADDKKEQPPVEVKPAEPKEIEAGVVRDAAMNRRSVKFVLDQWRQFQGGGDALDRVKGYRSVRQKVQDGRDAGGYDLITAVDGRFRASDAASGAAFGWDGRRYWSQVNGQLTVQEGAEALSHREVAAALLMADLRQPDAVDRFKRIELQGGDRAQGRRAFRLFIESKTGDRMLLWLSVLGDSGQLQTRLLKSSQANDEGEPIGAATLYDEYRSVAGLTLPHRYRGVTGLDEAPDSETIVKSIEPLTELPQDVFEPPAK